MLNPYAWYGIRYRYSHPLALIVIAMRRSVLLLIFCVTSLGACSWQGGEQWRRSTCVEIVDRDERARCLEEATKPEAEYQREVEEATSR